MEFITVAVIPALWFGILTSISPCPMATNITAISFIGKDVESKGSVILSGLFYVLGRSIAYLMVSVLVVYSLLSIPEIARFLQKYMNIILGPLLVIVGLFLLEIIKFSFLRGMSVSEKMSENIKRRGLFGSMILGFIFALSFCPVSAGLFFGSMIPLSLKFNSPILLPLLYGIGTALPVIVFAVLIGVSAHYIGSFYNILSKIEYWAKKVTGVIFILVGIYLSWEFIF